MRTWINYYKLYGVSGLEPRIKNSKYTFDFKLIVLNDIEELGFSISEAALKYNVPSKSTVRNWLRIYNEKGAIGLSKELRGRTKTMNKKIKKKRSKKPLNREEELLLEIESLKAELSWLGETKSSNWIILRSTHYEFTVSNYQVELYEPPNLFHSESNFSPKHKTSVNSIVK